MSFLPCGVNSSRSNLFAFIITEKASSVPMRASLGENFLIGNGVMFNSGESFC